MKKYSRIMLKILIIAGLALLLALPSSVLAKGPPEGKGPEGGGHETEAGNNLSFPVIWAEDATKNLPGTAGMNPVLEGEWWYWWGTEGTEPNIVPLSCPPDPDDSTRCDDGIAGTINGDLPGDGWIRAYLQKDENNIWQAESDDWSNSPVHVDWIDWGDNLESVDWYTLSQVRVEVVLFQNLNPPMIEYEMRHTDGWGIDEVHGLAATVDGEVPVALPGPGIQATVYSNCARLTIQKLLVYRDDPELVNLVWEWDSEIDEPYWKAPDDYEGDLLINKPIFNMAVHEAEDGPGYYNAEINVKGRVIYGYTWNVRNLNDISGGTAAGDYRITFSFDDSGPVALNTFFMQGITDIIVPTEEEELAAAAMEEEPVGGGGEAFIDFDYNLTYMDIRIHERSGGGGKPEGGGSGGGGPGGGGGGHRR